MPTTSLSILRDSGAPGESTDYTTVVLLHGFAWHSGIFAKLIPLSATHNARIVLVNRRDYPGAAPFSAEEHAILDAALKESRSDAAAAHAKLESFMRERAREVHDTLVRFVKHNNIPLGQREENKGGIVLVGWSFATAWMTAFLAHAPTFPVGDVKLSQYMRRVIFHDNPYLVLGFAPPPDPYNPLFDPSIPPAEQTCTFANWVSGYFVHHTDVLETAAMEEQKKGASAAFEKRNYLTEPPPTLSTLTEDEVAATLYPAPGDPGGSDVLLVGGGIHSGIFRTLADAALTVPTDEGWRAVEVRHVWCDRSAWEMPWSAWNLRWKTEEARKSGSPLREVTSVKLEGSNHFVHWDEPERTLVAFLTDVVETY